MKILVAGASGVVGRRLVPLLLARGHAVSGLARSAAAVAAVEALGARPARADVFDAAALRAALRQAEPEVVIHQLTALSDALADLPGALAANARIRVEGTHNLVEAALAAGARRMVAQSIAWVYADGPLPHGEDDALAAPADGPGRVTIDGVRALEGMVLGTPGLEGVVLRYGQFYGPGTYGALPRGAVSVHVDAAAQAAVLALTAAPGAYNIADDGGSASNAKARAALGWDPAFRAA